MHHLDNRLPKLLPENDRTFCGVKVTKQEVCCRELDEGVTLISEPLDGDTVDRVVFEHTREFPGQQHSGFPSPID
jgi:hypothetical protein